MPLQLKLLGGARLESEDGPLRGRAAHRRRLALLALLAAAPTGSIGRERIIALLWPEHGEDAARHLLSEALYVLRKELDERVIVSSGDAIGIDTGVLECDLVEFRRAVAAGEWGRAAERYAGPLLEGFYVEDAPDFERWVEVERAEVGRDYARALEALAQESEGAGDAVAAAGWWGRLAVHDPYNSRIVLRLMEALAAAGERARAVQLAAGFGARLREELGLEPDPQVLEATERLRSEPPSIRVPEPPEPAPVSASDPAPSRAARPDSPVPPPGGEPEADWPARALSPEFELIRPIGEGSMARVYLAREPVLGRLVAIKVLSEAFAHDRTAQLRFEREARAAARIQHPFVATVFRVGRIGEGVPYLVMPYVSGGSLEDRLAASGRLPLPLARRFVGQVSAGLAAAHRLGIVHRDVRPANLLHDRETDRVLLADFGIAAVLETGQEQMLRLTRPGEKLGNPAYASPEQLRGEQVTERADVYSLGIVAFELLTGRLPFDAATPLQMTAAHVRVEPHRVSAFRPEVDAALDDLVQRCLNKRPEQRPFAADVADALLTL
jgi:DNA-binding SARP family transcriptional activator/tRNA A-37 threonylcarbamoyl transferase component Bud32